MRWLVVWVWGGEGLQRGTDSVGSCPVRRSGQRHSVSEHGLYSRLNTREAACGETYVQ